MTSGVSTRSAPASRHAVRLWFAVALTIGLAARLVFGLVYWVDKPLTLDEQEYLLLARSLASGQGYRYPVLAGEDASVVHFERPPAYPALLAAVLVATGHPWAVPEPDRLRPVPMPRSSSEIPRVVVVLQAVIGAVGVALIGAMARHLAGTAGGLAATVAAAIEPPLVWTCGFALNETLYSVLALSTSGALLLVERGSRRRVGWLVLGAGAMAGVAVLTKEGMLFFLPLAALWLARRGRFDRALVFALGVLVVLAPWVARNHAVHGRFVLTAAHGGVTFWTGNNPLAGGEGDLAANPEMKRARNAIETSRSGLSPQEMDGVYYREALQFVREQPGRWLVLVAKKLFYTFVPIGPSYHLHSIRYRVASWVAYGILLPAAVAGLIRARRRAALLSPVWLLGLSVVAMNLVFFPQERFRIPIIDPVLIIAGAGCLAGARPSAPAREESA